MTLYKIHVQKFSYEILLSATNLRHRTNYHDHLQRKHRSSICKRWRTPRWVERLWNRREGTRVPGHSLALLTHSLAPQCSLRPRAPLRSLTCSLAYSLTRGIVWFLMSHFRAVLHHSAFPHPGLPLLKRSWRESGSEKEMIKMGKARCNMHACTGCGL